MTTPTLPGRSTRPDARHLRYLPAAPASAELRLVRLAAGTGPTGPAHPRRMTKTPHGEAGFLELVRGVQPYLVGRLQERNLSQRSPTQRSVQRDRKPLRIQVVVEGEGLGGREYRLEQQVCLTRHARPASCGQEVGKVRRVGAIAAPSAWGWIRGRIPQGSACRKKDGAVERNRRHRQLDPGIAVRECLSSRQRPVRYPQNLPRRGRKCCPRRQRSAAGQPA